MKPLPFKIPYGADSSIVVEHARMPQFYGSYHTHEELQLMLILQGQGTAYIGDKILPFTHDDIFLLGQDLPHVFKNDETTRSGIEYIAVFFLPGFMGQGFLELPESQKVAAIMSDCKLGIRVTDREAAGPIAKAIKRLTRLEGLQRLLTLVHILQCLAVLKEKETLTSPGYYKPRRMEDGKKINDVFNFLMDNYHREIKLNEVAEVANMSPTAFCRYFKQHTRKTYSRFLNEIRIGKACKMLSESDIPIGAICYQSGFSNLSNFNRQFKKITGYTPSRYQKLHR